jgi:hypothetical protein
MTDLKKSLNIPGYPFVKVFHYSKEDTLTHVTVCNTWIELFELSRYLQENSLYIGQQPIGNW